MSMSIMSMSKLFSLVLLFASIIGFTSASVCFSLPPTLPGSVPYVEADCGGGGPMPATGYPVGTQCTVPSTGCTSPSLSKATCLDGVINNEGYWSQPVCTVSVTPGFTTTQITATSVTTAANIEYAALVHLDNMYTTTSLQIGFTDGLADSAVTVSIYTMQDPVGPNAGPGDLIYTVSGSFVAAGGSTVDADTGFEVVATVTNTPTMGSGDLLLIFPTPLNFGNDYYVSVTFDAAGLIIPMECVGGSSSKQYWSRASSNDPFVSTNVVGVGFGCVANVVYVLAGQSMEPVCQPTLLTDTIGYDGSPNHFDANEPPMPYLDHTRSGFFGGPNLDLKFTYPTGVYDDIQFIPFSGPQIFGPPAPPTVGVGGAPPCGTTFQVFDQSTSGCQTTAVVRADFLELITKHVGTSTPVCGWNLAPAPVQYQGVLYSQWTGTIQIVTYQTVALFGVTSMRIKAAYANVVVRSPVVTSNAIASSVSVTDAATFQWSIVNQHLDSDSLPYSSITNLQTRVTAGYELTASATITSGSTPTPWTFASGVTSVPLTTSSLACSGTSVACVQAWNLVVENTDSAVCSLDGVVTITFLTTCNGQLLASGGCDANVDGRSFVTTVALSSVDFCRVVGGVTALTMSLPIVTVPTSSVALSTSFLTDAESNMFPTAPSIFVAGSSIGVYFSITSQPQIPITISSVSARIYDANERSHFSLYSDTKQVNGPYYYDVFPASAGPKASAFFNLPTGDQGGGNVYTPWLLTNAGVVNNIIVSVTASVQYDNVLLLGDEPHFITFEVPLTSIPAPAAPVSKLASSKHVSPTLSALASAIRATPQAIQTGTITQETAVFSVQSQQQSSSSSFAMSTGAIAGAAAGGAALLAIIIVVAVVIVGKRTRAATATAKLSPVDLATAPPANAASVGPAPTMSIKEDFYAPRVNV